MPVLPTKTLSLGFVFVVTTTLLIVYVAIPLLDKTFNRQAKWQDHFVPEQTGEVLAVPVPTFGAGRTIDPAALDAFLNADTGQEPETPFQP